MIRHFLFILIRQLNEYIGNRPNTNGNTSMVKAANISMAKATGGELMHLNGSIVASIVNIMEEPSLKNTVPFRNNRAFSELEIPPAYVNLYLLFAAIPASDDGTNTENNYYASLWNLSHVISFFQGKRSFSLKNSPLPFNELFSNMPSPDFVPPEFDDIRVDMEMVSLTFEQVNYLWGSLGGKQLPFVLYKAQVLPIKEEKIASRSGIVQEIQIDSLHKNPSKP